MRKWEKITINKIIKLIKVKKFIVFYDEDAKELTLKCKTLQ